MRKNLEAGRRRLVCDLKLFITHRLSAVDQAARKGYEGKRSYGKVKLGVKPAAPS